MDVSQIVEQVDAATAPNNMGPGQALEFLERLVTELEVRMDAIKDDMKAKGQDWG